MTCWYCGTELPATALFCGECGRSLATAGARAAVATVASREPVAFASPSTDTSIIDQAELDEYEQLVEEAAEIEEATILSRRPAKQAAPPAPLAVEPPAVVEPVEPPASVEPVKTPEPVSIITVTEPPVRAAAHNPWAPPSRLLPTPPPVAPSAPVDLEKTRIVSSSAPARARFVLQFSTGESVTVTGTGLIGRNPVKEPAEYFDHLVTIVDPGKSVSKTHLEFGNDAGSFWVIDRFSGNGTVVREPDAAPRRCDPGRRYRVARGSRVTIGEQFFIVS